MNDSLILQATEFDLITTKNLAYYRQNKWIIFEEEEEEYGIYY